MPASRIAGILCLVLAAACAGVSEAPPGAAVLPGSVAADAPSTVPAENRAAAEPARSEAIQETVVQVQVQVPVPAPAVSPQPVVPDIAASASEPPAAAPVPQSVTQGSAKPAPPPAKTPAKAAAIPAPTVQPRKNETPAPVAKQPEPPLDVASLKARLRETNAIGVFTKLALKNQVDDLLQQFRAHYLSGQKTSVAELRQPYDMLVLKVLALIQDSDPSLARTISGSREAIWGILADPVKFNSVN